nr:HNH endonuclease [Jeotgalibacillus malaysiensis]
MLEHTPEAKRFYNSAAWKRCRKSYISKVFGLCERCGKPGLIVHHKVYIDSKNINNPEVTLNHNNLEYLCIDCHNTEHHRKYSATREGFAFDETGNLIKTK